MGDDLIDSAVVVDVDGVDTRVGIVLGDGDGREISREFRDGV